MKLTHKQRLFVAEYLANGLNATQAAVSAGYSANSAQEQGSRLLSNVMVAAEIERVHKPRLERLGITTDRVIQELAKTGFANMLDYMTIEDGKLTEFDYSKLTRDQAAAIQEVTMDTTSGAGDGERRRVLRTRFKLGDKRGSLELLGKHLKLFTDKVEQSGPDGGPIQTAITVTFVRPNGHSGNSGSGSTSPIEPRGPGEERHD